MYYTEDEARRLVIDAGHKLIETGLIARTWGNISARISKDEFIITPSGLLYTDLTPELLVKVRADDLSYDGKIKPSSEKGIHAIAYILRPEAQFVIHTHQFYATAVSLSLSDTKLAGSSEYGLPGTKNLKEKMMAAISKQPSKKAFLMARHGAFCIGASFEDAFKIANDLEDECKVLFEEVVKNENYIAACAKKFNALRAYIDDFAQILGPNISLKKSIDEICSGDDPDAKRMILEKNCAAALYAKAKKIRPMNFADANLQRAVYLTKYSKLKDKVKK